MQPTADRKLAIVVSHPIQYYVPVFERLARKVNLKVFYTNREKTVNSFDKGFQKNVQWDIALLDGYNYEFTNSRPVIDCIISFNPTCLLIYGWSSLSHLSVLFYFKGKVRITFRGDSTLLNKTNWWTNNIKRIVLKWIYSNVDFAFYVGTLNRQYYQEYGLQNQQLIFAPHAVDNDRFARKVYNQSTALRSELNISKNSKIILFAGKLDVNKNAKLLLKAFLELDLVDTHLIFVGSGVLMKEMKLMSIHHSYVHFTSFKNQTEMPALYQAADLFCLPSLNDSWGLAINEAMAAGTAILVSDQAGAAIDLVQASNGRMFKSNDLSDLKEQLQKLMLNPAFLRTAGIASQKVIKNWNMDLQVTNILRCIQL